MRFMQIENGIAVNAIEAQSADALPGLTLIRSDSANIGDLWDGQTFTRPEPEPVAPVVPTEITPRQARLALLGAGLLSSVDAALNGLSEPAKSAAKIEWEYATAIYRDSPLVNQLGPALGLNEAQVDALFIQAASL